MTEKALNGKRQIINWYDFNPSIRDFALVMAHFNSIPLGGDGVFADEATREQASYFERLMFDSDIRMVLSDP